MKLIDRKRVRAAFDRYAASYDEKAVVQKRVVKHVVNRVLQRSAGHVPGRILDIGAGTGMLLREIRQLFPDSFLAGIDLATAMGKASLQCVAGGGSGICVEGDAEQLPFAAGSFDMVLSSSTFQWLNTLETAFSEAFRVLAPGGTFLFALFGEGTLWELRECYRNALRQVGGAMEDRSQRLFSNSDVQHALETAGFLECSTETVMEKEFHADVSSLLRSLREIGAGNASTSLLRGLAGRRAMLHMIDSYEKEFKENGEIRATYGVVFGAGKKG